jgi:drug/metabolite transporter (DMT)-like permease
MYVLLALVSCVLFGIGKFGIGRYRGRISAHGIVLVSATASAMTYVLFGVLTHELAFSPIDLIPALVGGACNVTGNLAFIKAAQRGKMGVVAGVGTAACVVPLMYSVLIGESLVPRAWLGLGVMAMGLLLLYLPDMLRDGQESNATPVFLLSLVSAVCWGVAIVVLDLGTHISFMGTLALSTLPQIAVAIVIGCLAGGFLGDIPKVSLVPVVGVGVAYALASIAFYAASNIGDIGVTSMVRALNPLVVAILAAFFLRERMNRSEVAGLGVVLGGACLIAI